MSGRSKKGGTDQPGLEELVTLSKAAELSGLSPSHLRLLVSRGDILGQETGAQLVHHGSGSQGISSPQLPAGAKTQEGHLTGSFLSLTPGSAVRIFR